MNDPGDPRTAPRPTVRGVTVGFPGVLGLVLAIPALFVFGAVALAVLAAGLAALALGPRLTGSGPPRDAGDAPEDDTITLDRSAYRTVDPAARRPVAPRRLSAPAPRRPR